MVPESTYFECGVCLGTLASVAFTAKDKNRQVDDREFTVMRCTSCGAGSTLPKLTTSELSRYYPHEYYSIDSNARLERAIRQHNQNRVNRVKRFATGKRLLDVGAGTGMFLKAATEGGFAAEGLELSEDAAAVGRATWGLNIRQGNLHQTAIPANSFDVVTLGHVYEHLPEPRAAAKQLHAMLKQGGLVVIAVPNFDSIQAKVFRSEWYHLDVPRHLFHFKPSNMKSLLEGVGFRVVDINFVSAEHNWAGILGSTMKLSRPNESFVHKLIRKVVGMPVARALAFLESTINRGGTFEVYAIKQ